MIKQTLKTNKGILELKLKYYPISWEFYIYLWEVRK